MNGQNDGKWLHRWVRRRSGWEGVYECNILQSNEPKEKKNEVLKLFDFSFINSNNAPRLWFGLVCVFFEYISCFRLPFHILFRLDMQHQFVPWKIATKLKYQQQRHGCNHHHRHLGHSNNNNENWKNKVDFVQIHAIKNVCYMHDVCMYVIWIVV